MKLVPLLKSTEEEFLKDLLKDKNEKREPFKLSQKILLCNL